MQIKACKVAEASVSNKGEIWSNPQTWISWRGGIIQRRGTKLSPAKDRKGYYKANLRYGRGSKRKRFYVHRLVAEAFIPNPLNLAEVNHINGVKTDNHVENLEWITKQENVKHAHRIGLYKHINLFKPKP